MVLCSESAVAYISKDDSDLNVVVSNVSVSAVSDRTTKRTGVTSVGDLVLLQTDGDQLKERLGGRPHRRRCRLLKTEGGHQAV